MKRVNKREWIKANRAEIDDAIRRVVPGIRLNDKDRECWLLNDEGLYDWARSEGVSL